jgi:transposase InsO family protein
MTARRVRVGVGTRFVYDGEILTVVEMVPASHGVEIIAIGGGRTHRMSLNEVLDETRARIIPSDQDATWTEEEGETAATILAQLSKAELSEVRRRAEHVREVLTGFRSGSAELKRPGEPRPAFDPVSPLESRYAAKATELGVTDRTIKRWLADYQRFGEAGLASSRFSPQPHIDERWIREALDVMVSHTELSRPTRSAVIHKATRGCEERHGAGVVKAPSRAAAYRALVWLEKRHPLFRLSTKRNRDVAGRHIQPYGRLQTNRPGEYVYLDTTRLDVFALDPMTLQWVSLELTVAMDAYTRCILGLRLTPTTKAVDAAAVLFQCYRPRPAGPDWPAHAAWPEHGIPRCVLVDADKVEGPLKPACGPAMVPETIIVDHGKIYVSEHLTSVCARMGISIQPARKKQPTDKAPVERFFLTIRESLLQYLDAYKGPDLYSRGLDVESRAFYYVDELEDIIREWVAAVYHHRPHDGLVEPTLPSARMSPAMMYEHGLARSGYVEVPSDPHLAYEFLEVVPRTIQHYGVDVKNRRYSGDILATLGMQQSPYRGRFKNKWPIYVDPDDIRYVYVRDPNDLSWHALEWQHAKGLKAPLSDEALDHMRKKAAQKYTFIDDRLVLDELLTRWQVNTKSSAVDRRVALRLARQDARLSQEAQPTEAQEVADLRSVAEPSAPADDLTDDDAIGDDDSDEDLDADYDDDNNYYNDSWEDA